MIDYRELDDAVLDYITNSRENCFSPWSVDSTGLVYPRTLARFGAEWYRCKLLENKHNFKVKMERFPTSSHGSLEEMAQYIQDTYNDPSISVEDMKVVFERNHFQEDGIYRVIFVYQELT